MYIYIYICSFTRAVRVEDHHNLLHASSPLKNNCVRQVTYIYIYIYIITYLRNVPQVLLLFFYVFFIAIANNVFVCIDIKHAMVIFSSSVRQVVPPGDTANCILIISKVGV